MTTRKKTDTMLNIDNLGRMGKLAAEGVADILYDRTPDEHSVEVSELGQPQWGYLHTPGNADRARLGIDSDRAAALCWSDGSEDGADGGVRLLGETEAALLETSFTGPIVERVLRYYDGRNGADDGHPAHALWRLREARRQDRARSLAARETHENTGGPETEDKHTRVERRSTS